MLRVVSTFGRGSYISCGMRTAMLLAAAALLIATENSMATMPMLTDQPQPATMDACLKWAAEQDEEARDMWGIMESGKSSLDVGSLRLALSCLGDKKPEIVGFGSSAGFDAGYCKKHGRQPVCKYRQ